MIYVFMEHLPQRSTRTDPLFPYTPLFRSMLGFGLLFGGVCVLAKWGSRAMGQRSRASLVGGFDRGLGAGFGAVKGLALATVLFLGATLLYDIGYGNPARPAWMTESRL